MSKLFSLSGLLLILTFMPLNLAAESKSPVTVKEQNVYVLKMPGLYRFHEVLAILKMNLSNNGWVVRDVQDVDLAMRKQGKLLHNKVLQLSKPEYLADAVAQDQMNALILSPGIVIYQQLKGVSPLSYGAEPGEIIIAFLDPEAKAVSAGIDRLPHRDAVVSELREAIDNTAKFFVKTHVYDLPEGK